MKDIFIGVDGGGSKTHVQIEDAAGNILGQGLGGPANIRTSLQGSWASITNTVNKLMQDCGLRFQDPDHRYYAGIAVAGTEVAQTCEEFKKLSFPFAQFILKSDGYAACLAAHSEQNDYHDGAIIIIGTGVLGYQIVKQKEMRVSGWGFPQDDEGSGAWLGLKACRHTLQVGDGRISESELSKKILGNFDHDFYHFMSWTTVASPNEYASLAPVVIEQANNGVAEAKRLVKQAAAQVELINQTLIKQANKALPCSLFGGLSKLMLPWLSDELKQRLVSCHHDPVQGAVYMIRREVEKR